MSDPQLLDDPDADDISLTSADPDPTLLASSSFNPDPPDPTNPNLDSGQVLYHMALGAQPDDFHPALQPLAQGFATAFQPQPAAGPGLLGLPDQLRQVAQAAPAAASTSTPAASDDDEDADAPDGDDDSDQNAGDQTDGDGQGDDGQGDDEQPAPPPASDTIQRLKNAQKAAVNNADFSPGPNGRPTHCNQATYAIAQQMGVNVTPLEGNKPGAAAKANDQVDNLEKAANTPGSGWKKIDRSEAQGYANQGKLAILGWKNPTGGSGHTNTVRPDPAGVASNPSVAQIGDKNHMTNFTGSFGKGKQGAVRAYVYLGN